MALVTQSVTPVRSYSPFEGMSEARRLQSAVPRGMVRFFSDAASSAVPVNDDYSLQFTCSLPPNFAYIISACSFQIVVDVAAEFYDQIRLRMFNTLPNGVPGNEQVGLAKLGDFDPTSAISPNARVMTLSTGTLREMFPQPLVRTPGAVGMSFLLNVANGGNTVQSAGTMFFNASFYQYELNQAVRFPLNYPTPVAMR